MAGGVDRLLQVAQRRGMQRGVFGASRGWLWVFVASWGVRWLRRSRGSEVVWRGKLEPGQSLQIGSLELTPEEPAPDRPRRRGLRRR